MDDNGSRNNPMPGVNSTQQPANPPQYAQPQYRQPVQPQYQQPQYAQPQYRQPQYGQPQYQQPQYQQPQYQQPQYRQPQYPQYQQPQYQQPQNPQLQYQQPQYQQQYPPQGYEPKPKKKMKWIIPVAIVAALIFICGAAALIVLNRPAALVGRAASNTANAILANELFDTADEVYNGGSVELNVDLSRMSSELIGIPMTIEGDIKMFADRGKSKSAIEITFEALGTTIDAGIYGDGRELALSSDFLLDGKAYGIDLSKAYDALEDSAFGPGGKYELDSDIYEQIRQMLKTYSKGNKDDELVGICEDGMKTVKEYVGFAVKTVLKYADIEKESTKLSIGGEKVKVTDVTVELDSEALGAVIEALTQKAADDKTLKSFLDSLCDYLEKTYPEIDDVGYLRDGVEEFYEEIDDILDNIDDIKDELTDDDVSLSLDFYINAKTQLIGILVEPEEDDYSIPVKLLYGPDPAAPNEISLLVGEKGDEMSLRYIVSDSDDDDYSASFSYSTWGRERLLGSVDYDKKSGDYDLSVGNDYGGVTLYGNMEKTKDGYVFSFDGLRGDDIPDAVNTIASGVKLRVRPKDTMPQMPDYMDVLKMSDKQIENLVEDVYGEIMDLARGMW